MADAQTVEQELLRLLQFGGLDKNNLANLVKIIAGFAAQGLGQFKVFPKGIPPVYEGLELKSVVPANELNRILALILREAQVNSVVVFPYGIPAYDVAELVVGLGPTPVIGGAAGGAAEAGA